MTHIAPIDFSDKGDLGWFSFRGEYFTTLMIPPAGEKNAAIAVKSLEPCSRRASWPLPVAGRSLGQSATVPFWGVHTAPRTGRLSLKAPGALELKN